MRITIISFLLLINFFESSGQINLTGFILDSADNRPLPFVNIGFVEKNIGTFSNDSGYFNLIVPDSLSQDSLVFQHVGYNPRIVIPAFSSPSSVIYLVEKSIQLDSVLVTSKPLRIRKFGVKSHNPLLHAPINGAGSDILELCQKISLKKRNITVVSVGIYLNIVPEFNRFRIKFYTSELDAPGNLLDSYIDVENLTEGWNYFDLSKDALRFEDDFFVSFEFIPSPEVDAAIVAGAILTKRGGFSRTSSFGVWEESIGAYSINIEGF